MAEIVRQRSRVVAIVGELVAARMTQLVRMHSEGELRRFAGEPSARTKRLSQVSLPQSRTGKLIVIAEAIAS